MLDEQKTYITIILELLIALLVLLVVYTVYALTPFLEAVGGFVIAVIYPFLVALILYYLLRPLVTLLRKKIPLYLAILCAFAILIALIVLAVVYIYPPVKDQVGMLIEYSYSATVASEKHHETFRERIIDVIQKNIVSFILNINTLITKNISEIYQFISEFVINMVAAPFILLYLLKDDHLMRQKFLENIPEKYVTVSGNFLDEVDMILRHFIHGRIIVSIIISTMLLLAFLAIGINYPFLLYALSLLFYIIPTLGFLMASILPLLVGFSMSTFMGVQVIVIVLCASVLEGFLLSPKVMGESLYIHPLTIIFILMVAALLFGILGLIFVVPAYALVKLSVKYIKMTIDVYRSDGTGQKETSSA